MNTYIVKPGDSLSTIARDVLHDINRWHEIAALNKISDPYVIYPDEVLQLPADDAPAYDEEYTTSVQQTRPAAPAPATRPPAPKPAGSRAPVGGVAWSSLLQNRWLWLGAGALVLGWYFFAGRSRRRS